ncbi:MAG: hypothetical protein IT427_20640 [Pirellulales bacterium]|nr:hypothetical protein [Pirellulales bacterium]
MPVVIGVDEAGYGPNLGPLVVAATVWEVADDIDCTMFYKRLQRVVASAVEKGDCHRVVWADSKAVYKNGKGFDHLERGVLAALATCDYHPRQWIELWQSLHWQENLAVECRRSSRFHRPSFLRDASQSPWPATTTVSEPLPWRELPWHRQYTCPLPLCCNLLELDGLSEKIVECFDSVGIRLADILARPVFPDEFNGLVERGNKSDTLSQVTLELVAAAIQRAPPGPVAIYCDKHGGRNFYRAHVQTQFTDSWVDVRIESNERSIYRFSFDDQGVELGFWVGGERFLPVALASMTAKYLREAAMRPFNEFWCSRLADLKPTAGYPADSRRFKRQIAALQQALNIDDRILWRER